MTRCAAQPTIGPDGGCSICKSEDVRVSTDLDRRTTPPTPVTWVYCQNAGCGAVTLPNQPSAYAEGRAEETGWTTTRPTWC